MEIIEIVAENIRYHRMHKKLSQAKLAQRAGISRNALSSIERELCPARLDTLQMIAMALGVPLCILTIDKRRRKNKLPAKGKRALDV